MNPMTKSLLAFSLSLVASLTLLGCANPGSSKAAPVEKPIVQQGITAADLAKVESTEPITADAATLWVNGLGCPLCATAIDLQLKRVPGVASAKVDLSVGRVDVMLTGKTRPSPARLRDAVKDAGFTLVKID
jgi:copper chaperone CopZ